VLSAEAPQLPRPCAATWSTHHLPRASQRGRADSTLRQLARWLWRETDVASCPTYPDPRRGLQGVAGRPARLHRSDPGKNTQRQRLRMIRIFFERLIEWDGLRPPSQPDPPRDIPPRPEPLPKFLSDEDAAKLLAAAKAHRLPAIAWCRDAVRTGMRATELCELAADAVSVRDGSHWLRTPSASCAIDRMIPLHAELVRCWRSGRHATASTSGTNSASWPTSTSPSTAAPSTGLVATTAKKVWHRHAHPTSSVTHWPPRPSTGACAWRPSPRCSATVHDMTLVYARIATGVADASTRSWNRSTLYKTAGAPTESPVRPRPPAMTRLRTEYARMLRQRHVQPTGRTRTAG